MNLPKPARTHDEAMEQSRRDLEKVTRLITIAMLLNVLAMVLVIL